MLAAKLAEKLGQQFYVEDIAGAGGNIGTLNAARSAGDGYTILVRVLELRGQSEPLQELSL